MPAPDSEPGRSSDRQEWFATTYWSVVLAAGGESLTEAGAALEKLCQSYWYPLYAFVRRSGHDDETAKDLTQSFFARFLEKNYLKDVDRSKGRFRSFLLVSLKHFLANEWDRQRAARRGGGCQIVALNEEWIEGCERQDASLSLTPEKLYERRWALALLDTVRHKLEAEFVAGGKKELFDALQFYLSGEKGLAPYAEVAGRLNLSVDAIKKAVERMRRRYGELLREEIAQTVTHPAEIDDEVRWLRMALAD
jgi:DNA-directed RNA polymerase specialized sigma24 family protein